MMVVVVDMYVHECMYVYVYVCMNVYLLCNVSKYHRHRLVSWNSACLKLAFLVNSFDCLRMS